MRPTTILSLVFSALLGLAGIGVSIYLLIERQGAVKWHYWAAPLMMIGTSITLIQLSLMYMAKIGRREMRSAPERG